MADMDTRLHDAVRDALSQRLAPDADVEEVTDSVIRALRRGFRIGLRKPRPRRETQRALSLQLPEVGTYWELVRKGRLYRLTVVGEDAVQVQTAGETTIFSSLKAAATAICGYPPSVSGWVFFFGSLSHEEVSARFARRSA